MAWTDTLNRAIDTASSYFDPRRAFFRRFRRARRKEGLLDVAWREDWAMAAQRLIEGDRHALEFPRAVRMPFDHRLDICGIENAALAIWVPVKTPESPSACFRHLWQEQHVHDLLTHPYVTRGGVGWVYLYGISYWGLLIGQPGFESVPSFRSVCSMLSAP